MAQVIVAVTWVLSLLIALAIFASPQVMADEPAAVTLTANPGIILADGKSTTTIAAIATTQGGHAVPDGTLITFTATAGALAATSVTTTGGIARVALVSSPIPQRAVVTARYLAGGIGANNQISVEFTNDAAIANTDQSAEDWVQISSGDYLGYGADSRTVDAFAKKQGVHFDYRGIDIDADAMQVDLGSNVIRARNATVSHDRRVIATVDSLYYEFINHAGTAVVIDPKNGIGAIKLIGVDLRSEPLDRSQTPTSERYQFVDISQDRVTVSASSLGMKPGDKIQFRRANVFVDGKKIISLPIHIMPLNTDQVFGQQVLGYGTDGMYLNVPYYLSASSRTTNTFFVRSLSASRENGTFSARPSAFSLDFQHDYKLKSKDGDGSFQLLGMQRGGDMGIRWRHNHLVGRDTRTYLYIDRPNKGSLFTTANIAQQFKGFSANVSNSVSSSSGINNSSASEKRMAAYVETTQRKLFGSNATGVRAVFDVNANTGARTQSYLGQSITTKSDAKGADLRFFTPSINLTKSTSLSDSLNFGATHDRYQGRSAATVNGNLGLQMHLSAASSLGFTYNYTHDPLNQTFEILSNTIALRNVPNLHRFGMTYFTGGLDGKWDASLATSYAEPTTDMNAVSSLNFSIANYWRIGVSNTISRTGGVFYKDYCLNLGRKVGTREFDLSWSAIDHRVRFNFDSARF